MNHEKCIPFLESASGGWSTSLVARAFWLSGISTKSVLYSLVPVAFWGCALGGQSGDDGSATPPRGPGGDDTEVDGEDGDAQNEQNDGQPGDTGSTDNGGNDFEYCQVSYRPDPVVPAVRHSCQEQSSRTGATVLFECECNGDVQSEVAAASCSEAMQRACGVNPSEPGYCAAELADCWETDGGQLCQCHGQEELQASDEADCETAAFSLCATSCEESELAASCSPLTETYQYACECRGQTFDVAAALCDEALQAACRPRCEHERGQCFEEGGAFLSCTCSDVDASEAQRISYDEVGHDSCELILDQTCGQPEVQECESSAGNASGRCRLLNGNYTCFCSTPEADSAAGGGSEEGSEREFVPEECEAELREFCPQAFGD